MSLAAVFLSAFLAATILPFSSEAVLAGAVWLAPERLGPLVAVATLGNTLGALVNWAIGRGLAALRHHRRFPLDPKRYAQAERLFRRFGTPALLLSWLPLVGDPLTLVAGLFRTPLWLFLPLVALGKGLRYLVVAGLVPLAV